MCGVKKHRLAMANAEKTAESAAVGDAKDRTTQQTKLEKSSSGKKRRNANAEKTAESAAVGEGTPGSGAVRPAEWVPPVTRAGLRARCLPPARALAEPAAMGEVLLGSPMEPCEPVVPTTPSAADAEDARLLRQLRDGTLTQLQQVREPTKAELAQASAEIECERYLRDPRPIPIRPAGWVATATPGAKVGWLSLVRVRAAQRQNGKLGNKQKQKERTSRKT